MWTALLLGLIPHAPHVDEEAWVERLRPPKLVHVDFTVHWKADLSGTSLGFPRDVDESLAEAQERIEAGERGAQVLLQASAALFRKRRIDDIKRVLPACLAAYDRELEQNPDDVTLAVGRARALTLVGKLGGDDGAFRAALDQLEAARRVAPGDPLLPMDSLLVSLARIGVGEARGTLEPEWFEAAEADAQRAIELAPREPGPRFALFQVRQTRALAHGTMDALLGEVRAGALELREAGALVEGEGAQAVHLAGQGFLFMTGSWSRFVEAGSDKAISPLDDELAGALAEFQDGLAELSADDELASQVLRAYWGLQCVAGDLDEHVARRAEVVAAGVDLEPALALALAALHLRGATDEARATAEVLTREAASDVGFAALVSYRLKVGENELALQRASELSGSSGAHAGARAVALLRFGRTEEALAACTEAARCEDVEGELAGDLAHARGVALALLGRYAEAEKALEVAERILEHDPGVAETLAEVRARR